MSKANTIEEVIEILQAYIQECYETNNRMGYFASLYTRVTIAVKEGIDQHLFEDNDRMERMDVNFANYFLENLQKSNPIWQAVFNQADNDTLVISQHLLLGMNAHINYDLPQATFDTQKQTHSPMQELHPDYLKINDILNQQIDIVQDLINRSWWVYRLLDIFFLRFDERYVRFQLIKARDSAWEFALDLHKETSPDLIKEKLAKVTTDYQDDITQPSWLFKIFTKINRIFEYRSIKKHIELLRP